MGKKSRKGKKCACVWHVHKRKMIYGRRVLSRVSITQVQWQTSIYACNLKRKLVFYFFTYILQIRRNKDETWWYFIWKVHLLNLNLLLRTGILPMQCKVHLTKGENVCMCVHTLLVIPFFKGKGGRELEIAGISLDEKSLTERFQNKLNCCSRKFLYSVFLMLSGFNN